MKSNRVDFFDVTEVVGTPYERGFAMGTRFCPQIGAFFKESGRAKTVCLQDELSPSRVTSAMELVRQKFPIYYAEIEGIAAGSGQPLRQIQAINCMHLLPKEDCSTILGKMGNTMILAHNEDHEDIMGKYSYFVKCPLENGQWFISHAYPGCIPGFSFGWNSYGMVITCNFVPDPNKEFGMPRSIIGRWMLEARNLQEAIDRATEQVPRGGGVNFNIASLAEKRLGFLETTANEGYFKEVHGTCFHSNHYIHPQFTHIPIPPPERSTSAQRLARGDELLKEMNPMFFEKAAENSCDILWDPVILFAAKDFGDGEIFSTLFTAVFEFTTGLKATIFDTRSGLKEAGKPAWSSE